MASGRYIQYIGRNGRIQRNVSRVIVRRVYDTTMEQFSWYAGLVKPSWAPPAWLFGPVWSVLYAVIAVSFGYVFYRVSIRKLPSGVMVPFVLNVASNLAFTPIQFGLRNNGLAFVDIIIVLVTLVWAMRSVSKRLRWVALVNIPYLVWVSFATVLQGAIFVMNR